MWPSACHGWLYYIQMCVCFTLLSMSLSSKKQQQWQDMIVIKFLKFLLHQKKGRLSHSNLPHSPVLCAYTTKQKAGTWSQKLIRWKCSTYLIPLVLHCLLLLLYPSPLCTRGNNKLPEKHRSAPDRLCVSLLASIMAIAWSKFSLYHIQNLHSPKTSRILFAWHFAFFSVHLCHYYSYKL